MKDAVKESPDVILRREGERVGQMQLQAHQKTVSVENKIEKLHSQIVKKDRVENVGSNVDVK
jgi:hypothetical protein